MLKKPIENSTNRKIQCNNPHFCFDVKSMKIIENALQFPSQMDYEKPKKTSMMQTGLKILSKNRYFCFDDKLVKINENAV